MIAITVNELKKIVSGEVVQGATNFSVHAMLHNSQTELFRKNCCIFVSQGDELNLALMEKNLPLVLITNKPKLKLRQCPKGVTILYVKNVQAAFWKFVAYYRKKFVLPVIAITGTCGKTTTKEMIKHILSSEWSIASTVSSINEPRQSLHYLTQIHHETKAAVFELGLGNSGNIRHQCAIYKPTIGIITNIGVHHLDGCDNLQGYIKAKGEIIDGIAKNGTLIWNCDDENSQKLKMNKFRGTIFTISIKQQATMRASRIHYKNNGMAFTLHYQNKTYACYTPGYGEHQVYNALAALAATTVSGFPLKKAIHHLQTFRQMERHLQQSIGLNGSTIIDDTWTNNPTSIESALRVLEELGKSKKRIVILGDIKRLGKYERYYHEQIGELIAKQKIDLLITIGEKAKIIGITAKKLNATMPISSFKQAREAMDVLKKQVTANSIVLIKGPMSSRSMIDFARDLKKKT